MPQREVSELLSQRIQWRKPEGSSVTWSAVVNGEACTLVMNDFPDEPLYTVTSRGTSFDIDELPSCWSITR